MVKRWHQCMEFVGQISMKCFWLLLLLAWSSHFIWQENSSDFWTISAFLTHSKHWSFIVLKKEELCFVQNTLLRIIEETRSFWLDFCNSLYNSNMGIIWDLQFKMKGLVLFTDEFIPLRFWPERTYHNPHIRKLFEL